MFKSGVIAFVSVTAGACALFLSLSFAPAEANQTVSGGRIIGTIVERDTNVPINAEVGVSTLVEGRVLLKHSRASRLGDFVIQALQSGQIHLVTKAEGYAVEHRDIFLNEGEILRADFQLEKVKLLKGTVRGPNGTPISGANVRVVYPTAVLPRGAVASTYQWEAGDVKTDPLGMFVIEVHPNKQFIVEASHAEFLGAISEPITVPPEFAEASVLLSLRSGLTFTGKVTNESGTPIAGSQVRLLGVETTSTSRGFISMEKLSQRIKYTKSGADGSFSFDHVTPGRKSVIVVHPGYKPFKQAIDLTTDQSSSQTLVVLSVIE